MTTSLPATAVGLGLRRALLGPLRAAAPGDFDFLECAPENWIGVGGLYGEALAELAARYPIVCHGHTKGDAVRIKDIVGKYQSEYYQKKDGDK